MTWPSSAIGASPAMRDLSDFRPHKSKGQNFLTQRRIADRIAAAARLESSDDVIEIGPGLGILSDAIIGHGVRSLMMIEVDPRLATVIQDRMRDRRGIKVINANFLELGGLPGDGPLKVIANLPFNVAGAILERLCAEYARITLMVLMFQREVAERIRARPADSAYGALSVYTALYWNVTEHFRVAAGNFNPQPKVDGEVLVFTPRRPPLFEAAQEQAVLRTIRAAFTQPRKTLRNSLASGLGFTPQMTEVLLKRAGINPGARSAMLYLDDFLRLARILAGESGTLDADHA